ncbi:hypothetical protein [Bacillus sp. FJAT-52991]|uniref:Leucine-rich repeat domain-containing protein n=1 Tax=Bacillus kandeliae TaxID=3129297 RepID=A0ABZ2NCQ4_9BACI
MELYKIGNVTIREREEEKCVCISQKHLAECIKYINENDIKKIEINELYYREKSISFLSECPNVQYLDVMNSFLTDISGVYHIKNLLGLSFSEVDDNRNIELDLSKLVTLKSLYIDWNKRIKGLEQLTNLKELGLWKYRPTERDLSNLKSLMNLEKLVISDSRIDSLLGIENMNKLKEINLDNLKSLVHIGDLKVLNHSLEKLVIESCKKIADFHELHHLYHLKELTLLGCGEIPSLKFAKNLKNIIFLNFYSTFIRDGDLNPCLHVDIVNFQDKKHYTHSLKDFKGKERIIKMPTDYAEQAIIELPTEKWRDEMEVDFQFTEENIGATESVLKVFYQKVIQEEKLTNEKALVYVKELVLQLNELNQKYNYFIETTEREELCDFIEEILAKKEVELFGDTSLEWREW